jgi:hypothetical protein
MFAIIVLGVFFMFKSIFLIRKWIFSRQKHFLTKNALSLRLQLLQGYK